jgi:TonB family protein
VFRGDAPKRYDSDAAQIWQPPDDVAATIPVPRPAPGEDHPQTAREERAATTRPATAARTTESIGDAFTRQRRNIAIAAAILVATLAVVLFLTRDRDNPPTGQSPAASANRATESARPVESPSAPVAERPASVEPVSGAGAIPASTELALHVGTVTDADTGRPIVGASVRIDNGGVQTVTSGRQGEFRFTRAATAPANARIQVSASGYLQQSASVDLTGGTRHLFQLHRDAPLPPPRPQTIAKPADPVAPSETSVEPMRVGGSIKPPTKIKDVRPIYPPEAQSSRTQGMVIIEATIGRNGAVRQTRLLRSIPALDKAALDAVQQWTYTPTLLNGKPVELIMTVTVNFKLDITSKEAIEQYIARLEAAKNYGEAANLLNRVFHVAAFATPDVIAKLRAKLATATDAEVAEALKAIYPQK